MEIIVKRHKISKKTLIYILGKICINAPYLSVCREKETRGSNITQKQTNKTIFRFKIRFQSKSTIMYKKF